MVRTPQVWRHMSSEHPDLDFPARGSSIVLAMYRLENISCVIHSEFEARITRSRKYPTRCRPGEAYERFRGQAFALLIWYVQNELVDAFRWYLEVRDRAPKRIRIKLEDNPFHWGLLAMTAARGTFLTPNKLRNLAVEMQHAHVVGVSETDFAVRTRGSRSASEDRTLNSREIWPDSDYEGDPDEGRW